MTPAYNPLLTLLRAFPGIPEHEAIELVGSGTVNSYPTGTILCHEDAYENIFYVILTGRVQVSKAVSGTESRLLNTLEAGEFFGEMALIHSAPRIASVVTVEPTAVLEIAREDFDKLLQSSASLSLAMVREVSQRLRANDQMAIEDLRLKAGELAAAYQRLAEHEYARSQFLTTTAHELRTPLTAAAGYLQMMEMDLLKGSDFDTALESVTRNVQVVISLVNNLLFLQEMDLILQRSATTALGPILSGVVERYRLRAQENGVRFITDIPSGLPEIMGDGKSLERALDAILNNAVKFSPEGGDVSISLCQDGSSLVVNVIDHGLGIPRDILPRVFDRFFHVDQLNGHEFRGQGLGLSIARHVIEQHKGEIKVTSQVGEGTMVTVRLPILA